MKVIKKIRDGDKRIISFFCLFNIKYTKKHHTTQILQFKLIGQGVKILPNCCISEPENIIIGNNVLIGTGAIIQGLGGVTIGNNVSFGPKVTIWSANHNYVSPDALPYDPKVIYKPVCIEDNVWIGARAIIVPGVTVHEGAVIAMGAVVTHDVPSCAVVGGNPARVVKYRDIQKYKCLKQDKQFFSADV